MTDQICNSPEKTALVTAAQGIGAAAAISLAREGANVPITAAQRCHGSKSGSHRIARRAAK